MKPEEQRIAIAEACGWHHFGCTGCACTPCVCDQWIHEDHGPCDLPDYLNDLNAMNEAEKVLTNAQYYIYHEILGRDVVYRDNGKNLTGKAMDGSIASATAAQRAKAFLKTLNLWTPPTPRKDQNERE